MNPAADFLTSLAQAVSAMTLYKDGHPARERAIDTCYARLLDLLDEDGEPRFSFLGDEIVYDNRPLRALRSWGWGDRLASVGIQRLEIVDPVSRDELEGFLDDVLQRVTEGRIPSSEARQMRETNIRYGELRLKDRGDAVDDEDRELSTATIGFDLKDETEAVGWLHEELKGRNQLHMLEVETIVRSLSVAMHGDQQFLIPLLKLKRFDQYTTTHALNVSILAMALGEFVGLSPREVKTFGIAGLLHDLGKVTIPDEILNKAGKLTDAEREVMNNHTVAGARIILETEEELDMAAVVAYEHHIKLDGGGYPALSFPRPCHEASNLVHVCDVFDALRTDRPYRDAWEQERVLSYMEEGAGSEFDPDLAHAFVRMMRNWSDRVAILRTEDQELPVSGSSETSGDEEGEG